MAEKEESSEDLQAYQQLTNQVFLYGSVSLALSLAQETGIIRLLCAAEGPLSSTDVAGQGRLKERYVREILNALTVAGLVTLETGTGGKDGKEARYIVPETRRTTLSSVGIYSSLLPCISRKFAAVRACVDLNGPSCVRYEASVFNALDAWGTLTDDSLLNAVLVTPGLKQRLEEGIAAAEVGCGTAGLGRRLAAMFPNTRFTLTDVAPEPLQIAKQKAEKEGLTNVTFDVLDVCQVPESWKEKFDWLLAQDVIHDLPHPLKALQGIRQALKPGGHFSLIDMFVSSYVAENLSNKGSALLYSFSTFMCIPESYQQEDSEALGACWGEEKARQLLDSAGFKVLGISRSGLETLGALAVCMCRKPE